MTYYYLGIIRERYHSLEVVTYVCLTFKLQLIEHMPCQYHPYMYVPHIRSLKFSLLVPTYFKGTVSEYTCKGHVSLFSETFEINCTMWRQACATAGSIAGRIAPTTPTAIIGSSLAHIMMTGISTEMKTKYCKEKQTDCSASLSILVMSISLALARLWAQWSVA